MRLALVALGVMAVLAPVSAVRAEYANPHGVAVVIGNKAYRNERVPEAAFAHRDAEAFKRFVLDVLGFSPDNLIDLRDATQAQMEDAFGNERSHEGRVWRYVHPRHGSDVVVFYSGHGVPGLRDRRAYLLPVDAEPDSAEINGYPIDLLYSNLGKIDGAKSVRVYLDACFSGGSDRGMLVRSASPVYVQAALPDASAAELTVLAAATGEEVASWDDEAEHGLFTHHLLDALYGAGDADGDGQVTATEAKTYLDDTMTIAARRTFGRHQNASLNGVEGAVLSRAEPGGAFPPRPPLGGAGSVGAAVGDKGEPPRPVETPESVEAALGLSRADWVLVEYGLASLGFDVGVADGVFDGRARAALAAWQRQKGLPETGHLTEELRDALLVFGVEEQVAAEKRRAEEAAREADRKAERERRAAAARRRADEEAFAGAKQLNTAAGYDEYLRTHGGGLHAGEARRLRKAAANREADAAAFSRAKGRGTVAALDEYLVAYPDGLHFTEARRLRAAAKARAEDDAAFAHAKGLDTVAGYDKYLSSYPRGRHVGEARRLRETAARNEDSAAFSRAKGRATVEGYDEYLLAYPEGLHSDEARALRAAAARVKRVGQVFRDCDDCPELVVVPAGSYVMGSASFEAERDEDEGPRHRVVIPEPFAVATTEVTRREYTAFVRETGYAGDDSCRTFEDGEWKSRSGRDWRSPGYQQTDRHPVVCVSWDDVQRYVAWLSRKTREDYRLPSESEWEYAARGGTETSRHWGDDTSKQCRYANGADATLAARHDDGWPENLAPCGDGHVHGAPAGKYGKNGFGLYDVLGNVWEWTADCGNRRYDDAPADGRVWRRGNCSLRILRGGSWFSEPSSIRSANRLLNRAVLRNANVGFRVARAVPVLPVLAPPSEPPPAPATADHEAFAGAVARDTVTSYDEYLNLFPQGRHAARVRRLRDRSFGLLPAGGVFRDCADCPEMVVVPMGSFAMGSPAEEVGRYTDESPVRRVTLGEPFAVGVREVTRHEYATFVRETGHAADDSCWVYEEGKWKERTDRSWFDPGFGQTGDHPAVCVSWTDAAAYAEWLSQRTGAAYRLPSEAEWEYAARGGAGTSRHWGDDPSTQCRYANGADETARRAEPGWAIVAPCPDGYFATAPAGRFAPNGYGLHDVLGNAWEWTRDCWNHGHASAPGDGRARERGDCTRRVQRGGSWSSFPRFLRSAARHENAAAIRVNDVGFRVARALPWAADDAAFRRARDEDTPQSYEKYLGSYPEGRHVAEAKRRLAGPKEGETFRDCANCPELVVVPSGSFEMGSPPGEEGRDGDEGPVHRARIESPFAVGVHEVTFEEWDACAGEGGCNAYRPRDRGWGRGTRPVVFVSWDDARAYVVWLSRKTGEEYRLLTESEWEYAVRAGGGGRYAWGDTVGSGRANCETCGSRWDDERTAPVGSFSPNAFGVHDMHGNVAEWVEDCWSPSYAGAPGDGAALDRTDCPKRVLRGGAWNDEPRYLRSANRSRGDPGKRAPGFGFRVARSLP